MAIVELTKVLRVWDEVGPPDCLAEVYVSMLPKEKDSIEPLSMRPIAVEPLLVRIWTSIKVRAWTHAIVCIHP